MSGGAATNAGIDFQQRVAAFFMSFTLTSQDLSSFFAYPHQLVPVTVRFETDTPIDDLVVVSQGGDLHFIQAKRSLSLSPAETSDFASVVSQFVRQYLEGSTARQTFWLVVGSGTSQRIKTQLKGQLDGLRLNPSAEIDNPSSKEERETLQTFRNLFIKAYTGCTGSRATDEEFVKFAQLCHIMELCVEPTQGHESVALIVLRPIVNVPELLLWAELIRRSLTMAKSRQSITAEALRVQCEQYLASSNARSAEAMVDEVLRLTLTSSGPLPAGKDVVLLSGWPKQGELSIVELFRFDNAGQKKLTFGDFGLRMRNLKETPVVLSRYATMSGFERDIERFKDLFTDQKVYMIPARGGEDVEQEPCVSAHAKELDRMLQEREHLRRCLHCGMPISDAEADCVELDDEQTAHAVGLVHRSCLRAVDRVVGRAEVPFFQGREFLKGFDFEAWLRAIPRGQRLFRGLGEAVPNQTRRMRIAWGGKPDNNRGKYCVQHVLADGAVRHTTTRGFIDRYSQLEAEELAIGFNLHIAESRDAGDPVGYSSDRWAYGSYTHVAPMMVDGEHFVVCEIAEAIPYTEHIARLYQPVGDYYAPLMMFRHHESGGLLTIGDAVLIATNPFRVERLFENWNTTMGDVSEYEIEVLESDIEFDEFMLQLERDRKFVLVDPIFDNAFELLSGYELVSQDLLISLIDRSSRLQ